MKVVNPSFEILTKINGNSILKSVESKARVCYKSEEKITDASCIAFVKKIIERGHEAMIEHESISVKIVCDRGISHEIVRHRLASYAQESTRYVNYKGDDIQFINPLLDMLSKEFDVWKSAMGLSEVKYKRMIELGCTPQIARSVLPNSLKTEIVITMNLREWRHFFKMRVAKSAHPQMRQISKPILEKFRELIPIVFDEIKGVE